MKVSSFNDVKVYDLATPKLAAPESLSKAKKRSLAKDEDYRRRIELIQDFEMPSTSHCIKMTNDGEYIMVTGGYPPMVRCFALSDLSMKFQRGLTCDVVAMELLSDDYSKMCLLQGDRTLAFHAPYGAHYSLRVPKFGRDLAYGKENCDLYVAASGDEIYRLNLEAGQFKEPINLSFTGCNKVCINPMHRLIAAGGQGGIAEFWDARSKKAVSQQYIGSHLAETANNQNKATEITALTWDVDGLSLGVGTFDGNVILYDIRSSKPLHVKEHQYGVPMVDICFHNSSRHVISTDQKVAKIWQRDGDDRGAILTNVETPADINSTLLVSDRGKQSGMLMMAGEQSQIMTYFVPQLGPAPRWCSFLEGITEELEEEKTSTVYEDFKFLTKFDVEELGASSLIGTEHLRAYMHGYFMEMKMYQSLRAVAKPFEYEEHRKKRINDKLEEKRGSRIIPKKKLPKVNKQLAEKMLRKAERDSKSGKQSGDSSDDEEGEGEGEGEEKGRGKTPTGLVDERYASLFSREDFQQDPDSLEYQLRNPTQAQKERRSRQHDGDEEDDLQDMYEEVSDEDEDEEEGEEEEEDDDDDDEEEEEDFDSDIEVRNPERGVGEDEGGRGAAKRRSSGGTGKGKGKGKKARRGEDADEVGAIIKASRAAAAKDKGKAKAKDKGKTKGTKTGFFEVAHEYAGAGGAVQASMGIVDEDEARDKAKKKKTSGVSLAERLSKQQKSGRGGKAGAAARARGNYAAKEMEYYPRKGAR